MMRPLQRMEQIHLYRQPCLKLSPPSSSQGTSKLSCCDSSWPTPLMVVMGLGTPPLQLQPPLEILRLLIDQSSLRQERLWRPSTGFVQLSPSLGSSTAQSIRRLSSSCRSYGETLAHGGPTTLPLAPRTTKCHGPSSTTPSAPITSR
jgi:hypothetical protein